LHLVLVQFIGELSTT